MVPPAPTDFWKQVVDRLAELIWERERKMGGMVEPPPPRDIAREDTKGKPA